MASNSRLAIAIHTAGILALRGNDPVTSELIATSVGTNPVVVRRIVGCLVRSGIVDVRKGAGGGAYLTRSPELVTIADIYSALDEDELFQLPGLGEQHDCPIRNAVRPILRDLFSGAEEALTTYLKGVSLADLTKMLGNEVLGGLCEGTLDG
jgi:Rrf2 family protein